jgi:hypothetical protein
MAEARSRSAENGFPLSRNMAILVTDRRLIVCRWPGIFRRRAVVLGVVPRRAVTSATLPFVGGAWRSVVLVVDGIAWHFRWHLLVKTRDAEDFVSALSA